MALYHHCPGPFGTPLPAAPPAAISRRHWITNVAGGMGAWALLSLLERDGRAAQLAPAISDPAGNASSLNPLRAKPARFPAKAKSVIFVMMAGGPSQMRALEQPSSSLTARQW